MTLEQVSHLTLKEFQIMSNSMVKINEMENPDPDKKKNEEAQPLTAGILKNAGKVTKVKKKNTKRNKTNGK